MSTPTDPTGPGPEDIPDPMPGDLRDSPEADAAFDEADPMEGDAPTG